MTTIRVSRLLSQVKDKTEYTTTSGCLNIVNKGSFSYCIFNYILST